MWLQRSFNARHAIHQKSGWNYRQVKKNQHVIFQFNFFSSSPIQRYRLQDFHVNVEENEKTIRRLESMIREQEKELLRLYDEKKSLSSQTVVCR